MTKRKICTFSFGIIQHINCSHLLRKISPKEAIFWREFFNHAEKSITSNLNPKWKSFYNGVFSGSIFWKNIQKRYFGKVKNILMHRFQRFLFQSKRCLFKFHSLSQIREILLQSMWCLLVAFDYSRRMKLLGVLSILGKRSVTVFQDFLMSVIVLEPFFPLVFVILPVYICANFFKIITQFRPYHDFFSKTFCHKRTVVISNLFWLIGSKCI